MIFPQILTFLGARIIGGIVDVAAGDAKLIGAPLLLAARFIPRLAISVAGAIDILRKPVVSAQEGRGR